MNFAINPASRGIEGEISPSPLCRLRVLGEVDMLYGCLVNKEISEGSLGEGKREEHCHADEAA